MPNHYELTDAMSGLSQFTIVIAETPAQGPRNLVGMHSQSGAVNFTAGNQSATTPITNPGILWGAAASAMLGATVAEWQRKREEESVRLAASRGGGGDGGTDEGGPSDVQEKRRAQKLAKVNPGLARQQAQERAVRSNLLSTMAGIASGRIPLQ